MTPLPISVITVEEAFGAVDLVIRKPFGLAKVLIESTD